MNLTMMGPLFCNLGSQGVCPMHQVDHNYGAFRGPPIEPAPCLAVHNMSTTFHQRLPAPMVTHSVANVRKTALLPGDWT